MTNTVIVPFIYSSSKLGSRYDFSNRVLYFFFFSNNLIQNGWGISDMDSASHQPSFNSELRRQILLTHSTDKNKKKKRLAIHFDPRPSTYDDKSVTQHKRHGTRYSMNSKGTTSSENQSSDYYSFLCRSYKSDTSSFWFLRPTARTCEVQFSNRDL